MNPLVKQRLTDKGLVTEEQFEEAAELAARDDTSLEKALIASRVLQVRDLGNCFSEVYGLPYASMTGRPVSVAAKNALSGACARRWKTYPLDYDSGSSILTMAVSDPDQAGKIERVFAFFMEPYELAFAVAPECEIEEMFQGQQPVSRKKLPTDHEENVRRRPPLSVTAPEATPGPTAKMAIAGLHRQEGRQGEERQASLPSYTGLVDSELFASLASALSLLVAAYNDGKQQSIGWLRSKARYCQLTATRMNLTPRQISRVTLAAWLSGLSHKPEVIRQFISPYDLESIIFPPVSGPPAGVEQQILTLVELYQDLETESPDKCRDVGVLRRSLYAKWPSGPVLPDAMLEAFLQVLMDEQFLDKLGMKTGRILLVDPDITATVDLQTTLQRAGYEVDSASGLFTAREAVANAMPQLVLYAVGSSAPDALEFCKAFKTESGTAAIPLIVLLSPKSAVREAELLRAGTDDFLPLPVDADLLFLKVEKQLSGSSQAAAGKGVTGSLSDMSFSDLIQVLSAGAKSTEISLTSENRKARVFLKDGNVIHAEMGSETGESVFHQLMQWRQGEFSMQECATFPAATIKSTTMSLLMEGARLADETTA
jgi:DNA-binding response OmpR family regulator